MGNVLGLLNKRPAEPISWDASDQEQSETPDRSPVWPGFVGVAVVGVVLGYLGWILPTPGNSIVIPTLIVLGVGLALFVIAGALWLARPRRRWARDLVVGIGIVTLMAAVWTFEYSIPASVAWSNATSQAQQALARINSGPKGVTGVLLHPCLFVKSGNVGPLPAPYAECVTGKTVTFSVPGVTPQRGLGYVGAHTHANWFPDECSRHLEGNWWMFTGSSTGAESWLSLGTGGCPLGYTHHGGG